MRIASYNIRKAVGLDGRRHPARVIEVVNGLGADVVVLQEADRRLGPRPSAVPRGLIARETDYEVADVAINDVSLGWHGNAILVRRGLGIARTRRLPLPGLEPRGAVMVTVDPGTGPIHVVGAHLGLLRRWRLLQLRTICDHLDREETPRTVVAGDFNEWSPEQGFEPLERAFEIVIPGRSFHAAYPVAPLDRFALGRALRAEETGVDLSAPARISSDHLPVWADVTIRPPA